MKILVTGAAGFIGSHLAEQLVKLNHEVIGLDCLIKNYSKELKQLNINELENQGVQLIFDDLARDDLTYVTKEIDFVFHFAAQPGIDSNVPFKLYKNNNIVATYRLVDAVKKNTTLKGFINISTSSVYGSDASGDELTVPQPISAYGVTKLAAEQLVLSESRNSTIRACSLRLFSVYGPRERPEKLYPMLIKSILNNTEFPMYQGSAQHIRSYTYIDDIMDGIIAAMNNIDQCNGEIFNIGTDKAITTGEGVKIVEKLMNEKVIIKIVPERTGDQLKTHANIIKARKYLGYNPKTEPIIGLEKTIEWYKNNQDQLV
jgi:nucleoside-diphosphate-sugar epimerase